MSSLVIAYKYVNDEECLVSTFEVEGDSFFAGDLIVFSDNSKSSNSWRWYFGDSTQVSFRPRVAHSFDKEGEYIVKLVVNNNCVVKKIIKIAPKSYSINKKLIPKINIPSRVMEGDKVDFNDDTPGAKSWEWRFGDGSKVDSFDKNSSYVYDSPGKRNVSLVINGDYKHVGFKEIFVMPKKESDEKREKYKSAIPWNPFQGVKDAPADDKELIKVVKGPEIKNTDRTKLLEIFNLIIQDRVPYEDFTKYFCTYNLPAVVYKDNKTSSLKEFYYAVKNNKIKIKEVTINKDADDCIKLIMVSKKYKSFF
ncbi:PKD domain-containing protein [Flavobacterium ardleyense]|uniref:PKD domain-containing protein n=1 Tax=Flavobacterium ardleyense TaxID=2038737 RepID=A0ABW5Z5W2_9FLAO